MRTYAEKFPRLSSRRDIEKSYGKNAASVRKKNETKPPEPQTMNTATPEPPAQEINETQPLETERQDGKERQESIEGALSVIGNRIQSKDFACILRDRLANGHDVEFRIIIKKQGVDHSVFFASRRKTPTRPIMTFNHVE